MGQNIREDLYCRLKVFPITVPPLNQRKCDIPNLVQHFIDKKSREMGILDTISLAPGALERMISYDWRGNVRELENAVERALIIKTGSLIDFPYISSAAPTSNVKPQAGHQEQPRPMDQLLTEEIKKVLVLTHGKVEGKNGAAEILKVKPNTLRGRMKKLGISYGRRYEQAL